MALTERQKRWLGALTSIVLQGLLFLAVDSLLGHFGSAIAIIAVNLAIASKYKIKNPYFVGARWATFVNLSWASYARHSYWYQDVLDSFMRLRDFNNPVGWNQVFCPGTPEEIALVSITSVMLIAFYYLVSQWDEWTERWESLRRSFFSASFGLQVVIVVTLVYPTAFAMATALFFASVISPIVRRQVRFNHIVFMMLVPLFSLGSPPAALFYTLVTGYFFLYFVSYERALTTPIASFSFFNGVVFLALLVSLIENQMLEKLPTTIAGLFALFCFALSLGLSYLFLFRGSAVVWIRRFHKKMTPKAIREHPWWNIRELWVDREIDHRVNKRYTRENAPVTIGRILFGPAHWIDKSSDLEPVKHPKVNLTPSILALAFYSIWFLVDAVTRLTTGDKSVTVALLLAGFLMILGSPTLLLVKQFRNQDFYKPLSIFTSAMSVVIFGMFMTSTIYFGLTSSETLNSAAAKANARAAAAQKDVVVDAVCSCDRH